MNVLVTGAFGNVGASVVRELLLQGHTVRTFDLHTPANRRAAKRCGAQEVLWGDIRQPEAVRDAVAGQDAVIHLVAIFPPHSEAFPDRAEAVNVGGTRNVLDAIAACERPPRLVYASSVALFGRSQDRPPPRTADDPIEITDHYTRHKAECERLVRASASPWAILRLCAVIPVILLGKSPRMMAREMFAVPADQRVEAIHTRDAGLALANAVVSDEVWGRTLLIGGGPSCQTDGRTFINGALVAMGLAAIPDAAFATEPFHTDFVDTEESERLLRFQRHSFADHLREQAAAVGPWRGVLRLASPLVRRLLLTQSPHYRRPAPRREGEPA